MATLIKPGEPPAFIAPARGETFTLQELQGLVGGYIEILRVPWEILHWAGGLWLVINADGKRLGLPVNPFATAMMVSAIAHDDCIVGPAVLCTRVEIGP